MLWLAPAGLRGGLKLEAYHQSRQPQSFFLCGPRCSGTSDRCSGRLGVISHALLRQPYLRPHRCGDLGFVSRHKPAEHRIPDVLAAPDVVASCITSRRGRRVSFSTRRCGVTVCLQSRRRQPDVIDVAPGESWSHICKLPGCRGNFLRVVDGRLGKISTGLSSSPILFGAQRCFYESAHKDQHPKEVAGQLFLEGKKQRVVNIVTVACW